MRRHANRIQTFSTIFKKNRKLLRKIQKMSALQGKTAPQSTSRLTQGDFSEAPSTLSHRPRSPTRIHVPSGDDNRRWRDARFDWAGTRTNSRGTPSRRSVQGPCEWLLEQSCPAYRECPVAAVFRWLLGSSPGGRVEAGRFRVSVPGVEFRDCFQVPYGTCGGRHSVYACRFVV